MRRRAVLSALAAGTTVSVSGCLGGNVVLEKQESVRVEAHQGWVEKIDSASGSGSISYTVRSEDERFQVFYFMKEPNYREYRETTLANGGAATQGTNGSDVPTGHEELSRIAVLNEQREVYEAEVPRNDGRYDMDFDGTHYFVVDYSNYGMGVQVSESAEPIQVSVGLEVVEDRL